MSGSKTSKKNGGVCKYIYTKGKKDGEECGKPARGNRCCDHNENKKKYIKKYNDKKSTRNARDGHKLKLKKLKTIAISKIKKLYVPMQFRMKRHEELAKDWLKKYFAMLRIIDPKHEKLQNFLERNTYNPFGVYSEKFSQLREYSNEEIAKIKMNMEKMLNEKNKIVNKIKQYKEYIDIVEKRIAKGE